jgi:tetratricopeptide (TPR) repeat protein
MILDMKKILSLLFLSVSFLIHAQETPLQNKYYNKAKLSFESNNLKYADKLIDKCLDDDAIKSHPEVLLLKSKILYGISQDPKLRVEYKSALKDALKFAEKTIEQFKSESAQKAFIQSNQSFFNQLLISNNEEAVDAYNMGRYSKALPLFKKTLVFKDDTMALVYLGDCYWQTGKKYESIPYFKLASEKIYKGVLDSNTNVQGYHRIPFRNLGEYYLQNNHLDSAYLVVKNGREILPNDVVLNKYTYGLMRNALESIPPSFDYLKFVQDGLKDFPSDSFLNHRENSIFIFLLNGFAVNNEQNLFDSLLTVYAKSKPKKSSLKLFEDVKRFDIFAGQEENEFYKNICNYFVDINLNEAAYATWIFLFKQRHKDLPANELYKTIANDLLSSNDIKLAEFVYSRHLALHAKQKDIVKSISDFTNKHNKEKTAYRDQWALIRLNDLAFHTNPKMVNLKNENKSKRLQFISETIDSGNFELSRKIWFETSSSYKDVSKELNQLWKKMVQKDFIVNYYGSRVNTDPKSKDQGAPLYVWNGQADSCKWGSMPDEIVLNTERRINYFRRMAGMSEMISLTKQDNELCQFAVLMCEANKSMSHSPNSGWRCYIPAGADALSNSILSKDANPSIAVTAAMGQNHATVGNRRWLLFPKAQFMGIGSSKTYSAIKALDYSRYLDSNKYKNQFIAWPPAKECPKMLLFKKWSFSLDANLNGATVSMKYSNGETIELTQEKVIDGYGLNTLVWEPKLNPNSLEDNTIIVVIIKLKDGKNYSYTVNAIDVMFDK